MLSLSICGKGFLGYVNKVVLGTDCHFKIENYSGVSSDSSSLCSHSNLLSSPLPSLTVKGEFLFCLNCGIGFYDGSS